MKRYKLCDLLEFKVGTKFMDGSNNEFEVRYTSDTDKCKGIWFNDCYDADGESRGDFIYATSVWCATNFTLIEQPVTFDEVLVSDKKVRIEHKLIDKNIFWQEELDDIRIFHELDDVMYLLCNRLSHDRFKTVIKEGKWYLEP